MLVPKVANTSFYHLILRRVGMPCETSEEIALGMRLGLGKGFYTRQKTDIPDDWLSVAFVRHPIDRLLSCYQQKVVETGASGLRRHHGITRGMGFDDFVDKVAKSRDGPKCDDHIRSQSANLVVDDEIVPRLLGRFERILEDWAAIRLHIEHWCGRDYGELPHRNPSARTPVDVTTAQRGQIYARYRADFLHFNYLPEA